MKLIIDIPEEVREHIFDLANDCNEIPLGINAHMVKAVANGTPIPDNATNGDIIKILYPNREFINKGDVYWYPLDYLFHEFSPSWWNSPYQKDDGNKE